MKRPAFQFYPADWRKDAALQSCSLPARGLWHEMMCLMHECEPYGHLSVNGKPMKPVQIARLVGVTEREYTKLVQELIDAGVPSIGEDGSIYSRRMVRDEALRNARAEGGKGGKEFGHLGAEYGKKGGRPKKEKTPLITPLETDEKPAPSSSSSSSETTSVPNGTGAEAPPDGHLVAAKKEIWTSGRALFASRGIDEKAAGGILGQLLGKYSAEIVLDAVRAGVKAETPDPTSYLTACCQRSVGERAKAQKNSRHNGFDETDYSEGVTEDGRIA